MGILDYKGLVQVDVLDRKLQRMLEKPILTRLSNSFQSNTINWYQTRCQEKTPILLLKVAANATSPSRPSCLAYAVGARRHNGL